MERSGEGVGWVVVEGGGGGGGGRPGGGAGEGLNGRGWGRR